MVKWETKYETGVTEVDEQHQSLFNYINDLEQCILDKDFEGIKMEIILNFFQMYCATHFSLEETCMMRERCPAYEENKSAHKKFLAYYKKFRVNFRQTTRKLDMLKEFHRVLIKWLANHIMKIDMKLKAGV
ncbi:MAG: bacteriohemerythrin [Cytophagales bacterium]|nr:bacteriohemerythrin [Cytophagales bacterium]